MIEQVGLSFSLLWRVAFCAFPWAFYHAHAAVQGQGVSVLHNDNMRAWAAGYSDSLLIIACIFFLFAGTLVGYFYPTPRYGLKPYPKSIKIVISITFGLLAFVYYLEDNQTITPAVCVYVAGVSFVAPAIIHLIHAAAIKFTGLKFLITEEDLDRINKSFKDKED